MKILAITDSHGKVNPYFDKYLDENDVDLVLICGDITNFGPLEFVGEFIGNIKSKGIDVISIHGNCDPEGVCDEIVNSEAVCIHNNVVSYDGVILFGFGGSNPTPFDTPSEVDDSIIYDGLSDLFEDYDFVNKDNVDLRILVTHAPPFDTLADVLPDGGHAGSISLRNIIEEFQPDINICGHIHEARAEDKIKDTLIFNPGPLEENHAVLIEVNDKLNFNAKLINIKQ